MEDKTIGDILKIHFSDQLKDYNVTENDINQLVLISLETDFTHLAIIRHSIENCDSPLSKCKKYIAEIKSDIKRFYENVKL